MKINETESENGASGNSGPKNGGRRTGKKCACVSESEEGTKVPHLGPSASDVGPMGNVTSAQTSYGYGGQADTAEFDVPARVDTMDIVRTNIKIPSSYGKEDSPDGSDEGKRRPDYAIPTNNEISLPIRTEEESEGVARSMRTKRGGGYRRELGGRKKEAQRKWSGGHYRDEDCEKPARAWIKQSQKRIQTDDFMWKEIAEQRKGRLNLDRSKESLHAKWNTLKHDVQLRLRC